MPGAFLEHFRFARHICIQCTPHKWTTGLMNTQSTPVRTDGEDID